MARCNSAERTEGNRRKGKFMSYGDCQDPEGNRSGDTFSFQWGELKAFIRGLPFRLPSIATFQLLGNPRQNACSLRETLRLWCDRRNQPNSRTGTRRLRLPRLRRVAINPSGTRGTRKADSEGPSASPSASSPIKPYAGQAKPGVNEKKRFFLTTFTI